MPTIIVVTTCLAVTDDQLSSQTQNTFSKYGKFLLNQIHTHHPLEEICILSFNGTTCSVVVPYTRDTGSLSSSLETLTFDTSFNKQKYLTNITPLLPSHVFTSCFSHVEETLGRHSHTQIIIMTDYQFFEDELYRVRPTFPAKVHTFSLFISNTPAVPSTAAVATTSVTTTTTATSTTTTPMVIHPSPLLPPPPPSLNATTIPSSSTATHQQLPPSSASNNQLNRIEHLSQMNNGTHLPMFSHFTNTQIQNTLYHKFILHNYNKYSGYMAHGHLISSIQLHPDPNLTLWNYSRSSLSLLSLHAGGGSASSAAAASSSVVSGVTTAVTTTTTTTSTTTSTAGTATSAGSSSSSTLTDNYSEQILPHVLNIVGFIENRHVSSAKCISKHTILPYSPPQNKTKKRKKKQSKKNKKKIKKKSSSSTSSSSSKSSMKQEKSAINSDTNDNNNNTSSEAKKKKKKKKKSITKKKSKLSDTDGSDNDEVNTSAEVAPSDRTTPESDTEESDRDHTVASDDEQQQQQQQEAQDHLENDDQQLQSSSSDAYGIPMGYIRGKKLSRKELESKYGDLNSRKIVKADACKADTIPGSSFYDLLHMCLMNTKSCAVVHLHDDYYGYIAVSHDAEFSGLVLSILDNNSSSSSSIHSSSLLSTMQQGSHLSTCNTNSIQSYPWLRDSMDHMVAYTAYKTALHPTIEYKQKQQQQQQQQQKQQTPADQQQPSENEQASTTTTTTTTTQVSSPVEDEQEFELLNQDLHPKIYNYNLKSAKTIVPFIKRETLMTDFQKLCRTCAQLPHKLELFYSEVDKIRFTGVVYMNPSLTQSIIALLLDQRNQCISYAQSGEDVDLNVLNVIIYDTTIQQLQTALTLSTYTKLQVPDITVLESSIDSKKRDLGIHH